MSQHATRTLEVPSCGDDEMDAIALCVAALTIVSDVNAKARIVEYLRNRYGVQVGLVK